MIISTGYGKMATPSENNSDYSTVATACGVPFAIPANTPSGNVVQAVEEFITYNGAAGGAVGGTYATFHALRYNQPL